MNLPVLANLKAEHHTRFEGFCKETPEPVETLARELSMYERMLQLMSTRLRGIDFDQAQRVVNAARGLLTLPLTGDHAALANAAVRYFLRKEADYDETTAVLNFSDDIEVINAVCAHVGHPELRIGS